MRIYGDGNVIDIEKLFTVDCTDDEDIPSGIVSRHPINGKVASDGLPNNIFDYLVVCPIINNNKNKELTDEYFKNKAVDIRAAVPQFSRAPPSLKTRNLETGLDDKPWIAEFGENDSSFAGIFKQTTGRDTKYFVCAQAGAPVACQQLREQLARSPMTFQQLLDSKIYGYCVAIAQRNARRLAYNVSRAANVDILYEGDASAKGDVSPWRANPAHLQAMSTIDYLPTSNKTIVGVFNKVTPINNANKSHFLYEGPYNGIAEYVVRNDCTGLGLPAHSGKHENPKSVGDPMKRSHGIICEEIHAKEHPDIARETFKQTDDETFKAEMKKLGWRADLPRNNLIPVVLKIYDPTIKRQSCV